MTDMEINKLVQDAEATHPLKVSLMKETRYYTDFKQVVHTLAKKMTKEQIRDYLKNKLLLSQNYNQEAYLQSATELSVIVKFLNIPFSDFQYERPINGTNKNPECSVVSNGFIFNVEAKCLILPSKESLKSNGKQVLVYKNAGRAPNLKDAKDAFINMKIDLEKNNENLDVKQWNNKDNTMKDFLDSAHGKFTDYRNEKEINLLFVALGDEFSLQEWTIFLYAAQGLFTRNSFAAPRNYSRVDAVILSNLRFRHENNEKINGNAWNIDEAFVLFLCNQWRQANKKEAFSEILKYIHIYTRDVNNHQIQWTANSDFQYSSELLNVLKVISFIREVLENENKYLWLKK